MDYEKYIGSIVWKLKREERLKIDGHRCQCCGIDESLEVHHKYDGSPDFRYPKPLGKEDARADLLTLCSWCHSAITDSVRRRRYGNRPVDFGDIQDYAKNQFSASVGGAFAVPQRTDGRPFESILEAAKTVLPKEREDGRRFGTDIED